VPESSGKGPIPEDDGFNAAKRSLSGDTESYQKSDRTEGRAHCARSHLEPDNSSLYVHDDVPDMHDCRLGIHCRCQVKSVLAGRSLDDVVQADVQGEHVQSRIVRI
jgi:hypothetical protein